MRAFSVSSTHYEIRSKYILTHDTLIWSAEESKGDERIKREKIFLENFVDLNRQLHNRNTAFLLKNPLAAN